MALNIATEFPSQSTAPDANYPFGGAQDITTPGDNTGTPFVARLLNDILGFQQKLLDAAAISPSGDPDTVVASDYYDALVSVINTNASGFVVGGEAMWPTSTPPTGFLEEDGSAVSRATYADLFAVIGTTYGVGDGSTTFNLPDMRGEFPRGFDNGAGIDPDAASRTNRGDGTTGNNVGTKQLSEFGSHGHDNINSSSGSGFDGLPANDSDGSSVGSTLIEESGGSETRPRNVYKMFIIKY